MSASNQITFILDNIENYQLIADEAKETSTVFIIDSSSDAIKQMAEILGGYSDLSAVHIISHGDSGLINLGLVQLSNDNIGEYTEELAAIGSALSEDGDILVYGCDIAGDESGKTLIATLAEMTGADIAASDDITGATDKGGDWVLEFSSGTVEAEVIAPELFAGILSVPGDNISYDFTGAVEQGDHTYITADDFFVISAFDGNGGDNYVSADSDGAYIAETDNTSSGTSYIKIKVNGSGSFELNGAVLGDFEPGYSDLYDVHVVGYANGTQVAVTDYHDSISVYETDYNLDFSSFSGVLVDEIRVYYSWLTGTPQFQFNLVSMSISNASTDAAPVAPPKDITFDFESNTTPVADDTLSTVASTVTQDKDGETIQIVSTGGDFIVCDEINGFLGTDIAGFDGNMLVFDVNDADTDGVYTSTRIDVSLQSGHYFSLNSISILDNYNVDHDGEDIKIIANNGTEYVVNIDYGATDNGYIELDLSGVSGFKNITSFYIYAGGLPMQLAMDNIDLVNVSATPVSSAPSNTTLLFRLQDYGTATEVIGGYNLDLGKDSQIADSTYDTFDKVSGPIFSLGGNIYTLIDDNDSTNSLHLARFDGVDFHYYDSDDFMFLKRMIEGPDGNIYFVASNDYADYYLYKFDVTSETISKVTPDTVLNNWLFGFSGNDLYYGDGATSHLYKWDGTSSTEIKTVSDNSVYVSLGYGGGFAEFDGKIYLSASYGGQTQIYYINGSDQLVQVTNSTSNTFSAFELTEFNGRLYYLAWGFETSGPYKMYSLGAGETVPTVEWAPGYVTWLGEYGGNLYVVGGTGSDMDLFMFNSTGDVTRITSFHSSTQINAPSALTFYDGKIYFLASTNNDDMKDLYVYDINADTITMLADYASLGESAAGNAYDYEINLGLLAIYDGTIAAYLTGVRTVDAAESGVAHIVSPDLVISDVDSDTLTGATVSITDGMGAGDVLSVTEDSGITASYDSATGVLTLSGTATIAEYQAVLRTLSLTADSTGGERTILFQATDADGVVSSAINLNAVAEVSIAGSGEAIKIVNFDSLPTGLSDSTYTGSFTVDDPSLSGIVFTATADAVGTDNASINAISTSAAGIKYDTSSTGLSVTADYDFDNFEYVTEISSLVIHSGNGNEFELQGFTVLNNGGSMTSLVVHGYKDGAEVANESFNIQDTTKELNIILSTDFNDVDTVWITYSGWVFNAIFDDFVIIESAASSDTAPTLTATGATPTFTEGGSTGVDLFETVTASTEDSGQDFTGFTVTVTNVADAAEYLTIGGTDVALTNGNSVSLTSGTASVSVSGGTATVTVTGLAADNTAFGSLIDGMTYKNSAADATAGNRVVTITDVTDAGSSNNTAITNIGATVTVANNTGVNNMATILFRSYVDGLNYELMGYNTQTYKVEKVSDSRYTMHDGFASPAYVVGSNMISLTASESEGALHRISLFDGTDYTYYGPAKFLEIYNINAIGNDVYFVAYAAEEAGTDITGNFLYKLDLSTDDVTLLSSVEITQYAYCNFYDDKIFIPGKDGYIHYYDMNDGVTYPALSMDDSSLQAAFQKTAYAEFNGTIYISTAIGDSVYAMYKYDNATEKFAQISYGTASVNLTSFVVYNNQLLYISKPDSSSSTQIYRVDASDTVSVFSTYFDTVVSMKVINNELFVVGEKDNGHYNIFKYYTDEDAFLPVTSFSSTVLDNAPCNLTYYDGKIYFLADNGSGTGPGERDLYAVDFDSLQIVEKIADNVDLGTEGLYGEYYSNAEPSYELSVYEGDFAAYFSNVRTLQTGVPNDISIVAPDLELHDVDGISITGATVTLGGKQTGDSLSFTEMHGITGGYDFSTGVLTLSGTATIAQYQEALRTVTLGLGGVAGDRDILFQATDENGKVSSDTNLGSIATIASAGSDGNLVVVDFTGVMQPLVTQYTYTNPSTVEFVDAWDFSSVGGFITVMGGTMNIIGVCQELNISSVNGVEFEFQGFTFQLDNTIYADTTLTSLIVEGYKDGDKVATQTIGLQPGANTIVLSSNFNAIDSVKILPNVNELNSAIVGSLDNFVFIDRDTTVSDTAPTLTATGETPTFNEGGSTGVDLFETVTASAEDSGQDFTGFTVTVTNVADAAEYLTIGGTDVALTNGNSVSLTSGTASVSVSGGTATVTVTGLAADNTAFGSLIDGMTYKNTGTSITTGDREITITEITDNGTSNNTSSLSVSATVTVSGPANDAAVLDLNGATAGTDHTVALADAGEGLAPDVTISDTENDTAGWDGGSLTIHRVDSNGGADGNVHDVFGFASGSGLTVTGSMVEGADSSGTIASLGTVFATWSYDSSAGELVVSFNSDATSALVQAATAAITYTNDKPYGDAKIEFALNDGTETTTADVTVTSNIIHVTQTDYDTDGDTADGLSLYEALAIAKDGDTILLDDGVYRGQFNITKNVTIDAANGDQGNVTIESPDTADLQQVLPDQLTNNGRWRVPVINVDTDNLNGTVTIKNITVDGRDQAIIDEYNGNKDFMGIASIDSNLVVDNVVIKNFVVDKNLAELGFSENYGILVEGSSSLGSEVAEVTITNSEIYNFQKTGIVAWGPNLNVNITDNEITGLGIDGVAGQNGMQIGSSGLRTGTTATITGNIISNLSFENNQYGATGIILRQTGDVTVDDNSISGPQDGNGSVAGVTIYQGLDGVTIDITNNTFYYADYAVFNEYGLGAITLNVEGNNTNASVYAFLDSHGLPDYTWGLTEFANTASTINVDSSGIAANGTLKYYMFDGNDTFTDIGSVDSLVYGGGGDDVITTGSGNDILVGGLGNDTLTGGGGEDVFLFEAQEMYPDSTTSVMYDVTDFGVDTITDFTQSDIIRVAGEDFENHTAENGDGLNVAANTMEVVYDAGTDTTSLYIDTNGIAGAELQINLTGEYSAEQFNFSGTDITIGAAPVLDLNGAALGTDATVTLAAAADGLFPDVIISDTENDVAGWDGGSLTIHRVDANGNADGNVHDVFGAAPGSGITVVGSMVEGQDSNGSLTSGGTTFATWTYDSSAGELVVSFNANATTALVETAASAITYTNTTPYGDAILSVSLFDGYKTTESTVTVTSNVIYVTQTDYDMDGDTADGLSLYEALAIAKDGDTILLADGVYRGQFNITKNVTIDAVNGDQGNVTIESPDTADLHQVLPDQLTNNGRWRVPVINVDTDNLNGTVTIKNITVDGRDQAIIDEYNGNKDFMGIASIDSNLVIDNVVVKNIIVDQNLAELGFSENYGIFVEGSSALGSEVAEVTISNSEIYNFQKTGIIAWGPNLNVTINNNEITGLGVEGVAGQNGMQIGSGGLRTGTTATITGNTIQNLGFVSEVYASSGVLLVYADDVTVNSNIIKGVEGGAGNLYGIDVMYVYNNDTQIDIFDNSFVDNDTAITNESDDAYILNVGSNDFSGATVAFYDGYDIDDPTTEIPVVNSTQIMMTSSQAPASGKLSYYLFGGNDSFTDNGSVDSIVYAGAGDDTIITGSGDDVIAGGLGNDTLTGGEGADVFLYLSQELNADGDLVMYNVSDYGVDTIMDFTEDDVIRVSGMDFSGYTFVNGDLLNVAADTVEFYSDGVHTTLAINLDNVVGADLIIKLQGIYAAADFMGNGTDISYEVNVDPSVTITAAGGTASPSTVDPVALFDVTSVDTGNSSQTFVSLALTVAGVEDNSEYIEIDGVEVALVNGTSIAVAGGTATVMFDNGIAVLTLSGLALTNSEMESLLESIGYFNDTDTPTIGDRVITLVEITDSGNSYNSINPNIVSTVTVSIYAEPELVVTGGNVDFTESGTDAVSLFEITSADTGDAGQTFTGITLTVTNVADETEYLVIGGAEIPLVNGTILSGDSGTVTVTVVNGTATVTITNLNLTNSEMSQFVSGFGYLNTDATATAGDRVITITQVTDSGSESNVTSMSVSTTVTVSDLFFEPVVTVEAAGGTQVYGDDTPVDLFGGVTADAVDADQTFASLTLTVTGVEDASEYLVIGGVEVALVDGTSIAVSGGTATVAVVNGVATVSVTGLDLDGDSFSALVDGAGYINKATPPTMGDRVITLTEITDNGGDNNVVTPNVSTTVKVSIYAEPELVVTGGNVDFTESGTDAVSLFEITSADTGDAGQTFTGITLTVTNVADETEYLVIGGAEIPLVNGTILSGDSGTITVTVVNGTATVTITNLNLTNSEMSQFVSGFGYLNTDATATAGDRVITITQVTDSGSESNVTSMSVSTTVTVSDLFFEPVVTVEAAGGTQVYGDDTPVDLFGGVTADAVDADQTFASLTLTVTGVEDASEYLVIGGVEVALVDGTSIAVSGGTATVAVVNGVATVSVTGLDLDGDSFSALVDGAGYINKATLPTSGDRVITLTEITDNGGDNNVVTPDVSTTVSVLASAAITSATYNAATGVLTVTGTGLTAGEVIDASKLSFTGEGGSSYTLTGTYTVAATATGFALTLNEADQLNVEGLLNSNGTSAAGGATFNIAAADGWNATKVAAADTTGNAVTVSSLVAPAISGISYNAETGVITVTGSNFVKQPGAANDIDVSKFTFTGQGGNVTLSTTSDVEISSASTFTITLSSADKALVNAALDMNGTASSGGTTYNLSAADDWNGPVTGSNTADTTNAITVSGVKVVETVDGVPVTTETVTQTQTYTDLNGNTVTREVTTETLTVAPVTDTRVNDTGAADTAEIPLFWGQSTRTEWATTASLPVGVGITTTGTRSPVDERTLNDAIGDLLYFIDTTASLTDVGRTAMLSAGAGFLDSMADSASTLIVNKVTLTVSGTDVPGTPIVINGTPNTVTTGDGTATPKEAIVIDASALPAGTELDLQNIEFAVIIGDGVIVRGGDGANIVFAGEGSQNILLGADDDELHAGDGDDIVGSLGGNDLIFGEGGNDRMSGGEGNDFMHGGSGVDTVVYTGSMSDYIITRDHGLTYISPVSDPSEVDTLVNAEKVEFSDGTYDIQNSDELTFIASLYEQILDRQPEINGFQYWADAVFDKDLSVGDMTVWFMKSAEYHDSTGVDFTTLSVEDQVEQLYVALLGRPSDADGKAYWVDCIEQGHTIAEVAESFVTSIEMQGIYNLPNEWDFTV